MKAVRLMSPAYLVPLETPDQFVSALTDADIGTLPAAAGPLKERVGGCAHKVVRWAFEAQGLYAPGGTLAIVDGPGAPPDPDIFIDDRRPDAPGNRPRGAYMPVPLDWQPAVEPASVPPNSPPTPPNPPDPPLWHARAAAIEVNGTAVTVQVRNRGASAAPGVTVEVWWIEWDGVLPPPPWGNGAWQKLSSQPAQTIPPWPGPEPPVSFGPYTLPSKPTGTRLLLVAEATCATDRANSDTVTALPCSTQATPLVDLIAGDNNLGLRLHIVP
jgi:hypothetical protein